MKVKANWHDKYISELMGRLRNDEFDELDANVVYKRGEMDVHGRKNGDEYYFEVKSSGSGRSEGIRQLRRWRDCNSKRGYLYIGSTRKLERVF